MEKQLVGIGLVALKACFEGFLENNNISHVEHAELSFVLHESSKHSVRDGHHYTHFPDELRPVEVE